MAEIKINNLLKFYALSLIASGPKHGYELIKELESKFDRKVSASNVYPFLNLLKKNKLIKFDRIGDRDRKVFHLTAEGKKFTQEMFSKFGDLIDIAIEPKITTCPCGCRIYSGGFTKKIHGRAMKFCCSHCAEGHK